MKKRHVQIIFILLILTIGIFFITAVAVDKSKAWHSADSDIRIKIDGVDKTLQQAINENLLYGSHTYASPSPIPTPWHDASQIWVSVDGAENTLLNALSSANKLCGNSLTLGYSNSSPSIPAPSHLATEIEVSVDGTAKRFQEAIDTIKFCSGYGNTWTPKESSRGWSSIAMSADGRYQTAIAWNSQIYVSSDYGANWIAKGINKYWGSIAMSADGRYQTAVTLEDPPLLLDTPIYDAHIYASSDYGNTWNLKASYKDAFYDIAMSTDGKYQTAVPAGSIPSSVYVSSDYGKTWVASKQMWDSWRGIAMSADGTYQTIIGTSGYSYGGDLYISSDHGATWTSPLGFARQWKSVSMSADGRYQTAIASDSQIYVSSDYGANWIAKGINREWRMITMSADGKYQTAVVFGGQIHVSA